MRGNWWILALALMAVVTLINGFAEPTKTPESLKLPPVVIDLSHFGLGYATAEIEKK